MADVITMTATRRPKGFKKFVTPQKLSEMLHKVANAVAENQNPGVKMKCRVRITAFVDKKR